MEDRSSPQITECLRRWYHGEEHALDDLMPLVYDRLRQIAFFQLQNERPGHTLQPSDLVHEAYLKIGREPKIDWNNRLHFLAVAAHAMRQILVDYARKRNADKGPGQYEWLALNEALAFTPEKSSSMLALDEALTNLANEEPRKARVVELRIFGGLDNSEIGSLLGISANTVMRDWDFALSRLMALMRDDNSDERRRTQES